MDGLDEMITGVVEGKIVEEVFFSRWDERMLILDRTLKARKKMTTKPCSLI